MSTNQFKHVAKNVLYVSIATVAAVTITKTIVRSRKEAKYTPAAVAHDKTADSEVKEYYNDLAKIKPGFPLPSESSESKDDERKSEYEGTGMSVLSRRRGDRLGFFDRKGDK